MRFRGGSARLCSSACRPVASPTQPGPNEWILITPSRMCRRAVVARPARPGYHNLGPMSRLEHRVKTHSRWQVRQPQPGVWIWRSPHRAYYLVTNAGTQYLGDGPFARRVWKAAMPPRQSLRRGRITP